jgi:hypothetical protein
MFVCLDLSFFYLDSYNSYNNHDKFATIHIFDNMAVKVNQKNTTKM